MMPDVARAHSLVISGDSLLGSRRVDDAKCIKSIRMSAEAMMNELLSEAMEVGAPSAL